MSTTEYHKAFKAGLNYSFSKYAVALGYEQIDPGYETLGTYFFNNDLENITAGLTGQLLNDKLSLGINTGVQRNNLDQDKISTQRRLVSSINCNYSPVDRWNFSGSYSNFTSNSRRAARFDEIVEGADSVSFYFVQVTDNADLSAAYMINGETSNSAITLTLNWQEANERQGRQVTGRRSDNYNANLGYSFRRKNGIGISTSINTNRSISRWMGIGWYINWVWIGPNFWGRQQTGCYQKWNV